MKRGGLALLAMCMLAHLGVADPAPSNSIGLKVSLMLTDAAGNETAQIRPQEPIGVQLRFSDALSGKPSTGLMPAAWFRRVVDGMSPCAEAARAFRSTGSLSKSEVSLVGRSILSVDRHGRLAIIEPDYSLSGANIAALVPLGEVPASVLAAHDGTVLMTLPGQGKVVSLAPQDGRVKDLLTGLLSPHALLEGGTGRFWISEPEARRARLVTVKGEEVVRIAVPARLSALLSDASNLVVAVHDAGGAMFLQKDTGAVVATIEGGTLSPPFAAVPGAIVSSKPGDGTSLQVIYADDPTRSREVGLSGVPSLITTSHDGRYALVWSASSETIDIVDLGLLRLLHTSKSSDYVDDAVFSGNTAFLSYRNRPVITVLNASLVSEGDASIRDIRLAEAPRSAKLGDHDRNLLIPLISANGVLAARAQSQTIFTVMDGGGIANAPMSALSIKSEPPVFLALHNRNLVEQDPGRYLAFARLPAGGDWELTVTTGVRGTTACFPVSVAGPPGPRVEPARLMVLANPDLKPRAPAQLVLRVDGARGPQREKLRLIASALDGGWLKHFDAALQVDGTYRGLVTFPWPGSFPIAIADSIIDPVVVVVAP